MANTKWNKKKIGTAALALLLLASAIGGTIAYMNVSNSKVNTFTVGNISKPTTDPEDKIPDPDNPDGPDIPKPIEPALDGNIYEPGWDDATEHKLIPGGSLTKDPYVGIGKGSEESVVYVKVENNLPDAGKDHVYFELNSGWTAVDADAITKDEKTVYSAGIFKYNTTLTAADADAWTTPIFSDKIIHVDEDATTESLTPEGESTPPSVTITCYLHQAKDGDGNEIDAGVIEANAIAELTKTATP